MNFVAAAGELVAQGWPVTPVHGPHDGIWTCGDLHCSHPGKHPIRRGWKRGTTDETVIASIWGVPNPPNIGIPTGKRSGIVAIDIDPRHGGDKALADLERKYGSLPATVTSLTGQGGKHLLF